MKNEKTLSRIVIDPKIMTGKPIIKGTRLTVQFILGLLAHGMTIQEIIEEYNMLTKEDILECIMFAHNALENTLFAPLST